MCCGIKEYFYFLPFAFQLVLDVDIASKSYKTKKRRFLHTDMLEKHMNISILKNPQKLAIFQQKGYKS